MCSLHRFHLCLECKKYYTSQSPCTNCLIDGKEKQTIDSYLKQVADYASVVNAYNCCYLCNLPYWKPKILRKTVDHILPLSKFHNNNKSNKAYAHCICNEAKGNKILHVYLNSDRFIEVRQKIITLLQSKIHELPTELARSITSDFSNPLKDLVFKFY